MFEQLHVRTSALESTEHRTTDFRKTDLKLIWFFALLSSGLRPNIETSVIWLGC